MYRRWLRKQFVFYGRTFAVNERPAAGMIYIGSAGGVRCKLSKCIKMSVAIFINIDFIDSILRLLSQ